MSDTSSETCKGCFKKMPAGREEDSVQHRTSFDFDLTERLHVCTHGFFSILLPSITIMADWTLKTNHLSLHLLPNTGITIMADWTLKTNHLSLHLLPNTGITIMVDWTLKTNHLSLHLLPNTGVALVVSWTLKTDHLSLYLLPHTGQVVSQTSAAAAGDGPADGGGGSAALRGRADSTAVTGWRGVRPDRCGVRPAAQAHCQLRTVVRGTGHAEGAGQWCRDGWRWGRDWCGVDGGVKQEGRCVCVGGGDSRFGLQSWSPPL